MLSASATETMAKAETIRLSVDQDPGALRSNAEFWGDLVRALLTGGLLACQYALSTTPRRSFLAANLGCFVVAFFVNNRLNPGKAGPTPVPRSAMLLGGVGLVLLNELIVGYQRMGDLGFMTSALLTCHELAMLGTIWVSARERGKEFLRPVLLTLASAFIIYAFFNVAADRVGFAVAGLKEREEIFSSRYVEGEYRWQAPLTSSWQLSGIARWAAALLVWVGYGALQRRAWKEFVICVAMVLFSGYVMAKTEYRFAAAPSAVVVILVLAARARWRAVLCGAAVLYPFVVPFLFASNPLREFAVGAFGEMFSTILRQSPEEWITLSGRSEIWEQAVPILFSDKYLFVGEGHYSLDAAADVPGDFFVSSDLFRRMSFHQGVLDLYFIYGTLLASFLCWCVVYIAFLAVRAAWQSTRNRPVHPLTMLALVNLAVIAISNAHDGFVLEHNFFYVATIASLHWIWLQRRARAPLLRPEASPVPVPRPQFAPPLVRPG